MRWPRIDMPFHSLAQAAAPETMRAPVFNHGGA
jgi:hypothetical protein